MMCAFGITLALLERNKSGKGQVVDCAMVDSAAYLASFVFSARKGIWAKPAGENMLDGGGMGSPDRTRICEYLIGVCSAIL